MAYPNNVQASDPFTVDSVKDQSHTTARRRRHFLPGAARRPIAAGGTATCAVVVGKTGGSAPLPLALTANLVFGCRLPGLRRDIKFSFPSLEFDLH